MLNLSQNMLRMALHPEYYRTGAERPDDEDDPLGEWHLSHCLDSIRQSIMCNPVSRTCEAAATRGRMFLLTP